jgi:colanic acid/amylovoran biosynthesis glycosyltransferase
MIRQLSITAEDGDSEGLGMVLLEAQFMKLPIISSLHEAIKEAVIDGYSGFLVIEKDIAEIANKLEYLIQNPEKRIELGLNGHNFVKSQYNQINALNQIINDYECALQYNADQSR